MSLIGTAPARAWWRLAAVLALGSLVAWFSPAERLDWQPALVLAEPWRAFSGAWVHWSEQHLVANLAGLALVAGLGTVARLPVAAAGAWLLAWPATQLGLLWRPELAHYGGLSGVLHAGVAVAAVWMLLGSARPLQPLRPVAALLLLGLVAKLLWERPWGPVLTHPAGWDIAVAPLAHATGAMAGLLAGAVAVGWARRPQGPEAPDLPGAQGAPGVPGVPTAKPGQGQSTHG